jgi:hypothetical protein
MLRLADIGGGATVFGKYWEIEIDRDGGCQLETSFADDGEPVGLFETRLAPRLTKQLAEAVSQAASACPRASYPGAGGGNCMGYCEIDLRTLDGRLRTIGFGPDHTLTPEPLRRLYTVNSRTFLPGGLVWTAHQVAHKHPSAAVALSVSPDKPSYGIGEPLHARVVATSAGTQAAAFASPDCTAIVYGRVRVMLYRRLPPLSPPSGPMSLREEIWFGGEWGRPLIPNLLPEARRDLRRVLILEPGEQYVFDFPRPLRVESGRLRALRAGYAVGSRYPRQAIDRELGAHLVTGSLNSKDVRIELH